MVDMTAFDMAAQGVVEPNNLVDLIHFTPGQVVSALRAVVDTGKQIHMTNGAYSQPDAVRTAHEMVAGFKYLQSGLMQAGDVLLVAVNSTDSMAAIMQAKGQTLSMDVEARRFQNYDMMMDVLAAQFPDNTVVMCSYDEATPTELYAALKAAGMNTATLFKYGGYGAGQGAPIMPGAESVTVALNYPLNFGEKAMAEDVTPTGANGTIARVDLQNTVPPYLTAERHVAFPLTDAAAHWMKELESAQQPAQVAVAAPARAPQKL